jgi:hypothetical protein
VAYAALISPARLIRKPDNIHTEFPQLGRLALLDLSGEGLVGLAINATS